MWRLLWGLKHFGIYCTSGSALVWGAFPVHKISSGASTTVVP